MTKHFMDVEQEWILVISDLEKYLYYSIDSSIHENCIFKIESLIEEFQICKEQLRSENDGQKYEHLLSLVWMRIELSIALILHFKMFIHLKKKEYVKAWNALVDSQQTTMAVKKIFPHPNLENRIRLLLTYEELFFPPQIFSSVGYLITEDECSICGKGYQGCEHKKGSVYGGEMCVQIVKKSIIEEVSIVDNPKDKKCRAEYRGKTNLFTYLEEE